MVSFLQPVASPDYDADRLSEFISSLRRGFIQRAATDP